MPSAFTVSYEVYERQYISHYDHASFGDWSTRTSNALDLVTKNTPINEKRSVMPEVGR